MTNGPYLAEADNFDSGVYQLQTTDPALGGPGGIMNVPPTSLANRSRFLFNRSQDGKMTYAADTGVVNAYVALLNPVTFAALVDGMEVRLRIANANTGASTFTPSNGTVAGSPNITPLPILGGDGSALTGGELAVNSEVTLRYNAALNSGNGAWMIMASAGGIHRSVTPAAADNSTKVSTTAWVWNNILALVNSVIGSVTGVTPAQFDNSTKLPTTAFVQRALGNFSGVQIYGASQVITAAQAGELIEFNGAAASTFTLPNPSTVVVGGSYTINNYGTANLTVTTTGGTATFNPWTGTPTSIVILPGQSVEVAADGTYYVITSVSGNIATPAQNDNTNKPATTQFVMQQLTGLVGAVRNGYMSIPAQSATATFSADQVVVATALNGVEYLIPNYSKTINLAVTGVGGMDTGAAPNSGFVALYAIYNPVTGASSILATNTTTTLAPSVYGGANMPAGYTASALLSVWPTSSAGLFLVGIQVDRSIFGVGGQAVSSTTQIANTSIASVSIASLVPKNAKTVAGALQINAASGSQNTQVNIYSFSNGGVSFQAAGYQAGQGQISSQFVGFPLGAPQQIWWSCNTSTGAMNNAGIILNGYTI